jgi:hypothetical protein
VDTRFPGNDEPLEDEDELRRLMDRQALAGWRVEKERRELLVTWLSSGSTEAEFNEAWPAIHAQLGRMRVQELGEKARHRSLQRFRKSS